MLAVKHINRIVAIVACFFMWQANAYIYFVEKLDDNSGNKITAKQMASNPTDTNRFTTTLMNLIDLNDMPSNTRGPIHDTPSIPCRCREYIESNGSSLQNGVD